MFRTFKTSDCRKLQELSGSGWTFTPLEGSNIGAENYSEKVNVHPNLGKSYKVSVPGCIENIPSFESFRGTGRYEKTFVADGNIRLVFKGVSHTGTVFLDGKELGRHYNAYTPFEFVIKNLPQALHKLEVVVDHRFGEDSALHVPNDYMTYLGITRGVFTQTLGDAFIDYFHVTPILNDGKWQLKVSIRVTNLLNEDLKVHLEVEMPELIEDYDASLHKGSKGPILDKCLNLKPYEGLVTTEIVSLEDVSQSFKSEQISLWSPEHPALYSIKARLVEAGEIIDDNIERFGFRTIETKGSHILLNGKMLRIKGFCRHEDHPMFGCALPFQAMDYDLQLIKDMGANAIRTSHYPNDELFLDLCDERGILVWEENHARGLSEEQMRNPNFESQAEMCIEEMIKNHINHPSIIIWGILNECASDTEYGRQCYAKQYELIRSMDSTRPCSSASCKFMNDICLDLPDIVSYNLYPEWYVEKSSKDWVSENYDWVQKQSGSSGKPFLITEIGAGAIYGYRSPIRSKWTEEYQAEALSHQISAVLQKEGCSGIFIWQFCDARISFEWFQTRPRTMNNKGVVDEYRRPKLSYDVVKELYSSYSDYFE